MGLWQIAARNLWQNRGRYIAYLASAAFGVTIYFLYSALVYHPDLQSGYYGAKTMVKGMKAAAVVIAIASFLFLLYSNAAFVRGRMKEFGLLSLLGLSRRQLAALVLIESMLIGTAAMTIGLGAGLLFLKLFFMAISVLLQLPEQIPAYAAPRAWGQTLLLFGGLYLLVSLASLRTVLGRRIVELVKAGRQPKGRPTFSRWKAALGLILMLGGYAWASIPDTNVVVAGIIPVTAMVSVGTYLLLREGSIAWLSWLHGRERFFYQPGPFLSVSQLIYKMQDNYRILSAVAVLVAVILSAVGTSFSLYRVSAADALRSHPHAVQLAGDGAGDHEAAGVEAILRAHGVTGLNQEQLRTRLGELQSRQIPVVLLPYSFYASVERPGGSPLPAPGEGEAILVIGARLHAKQPALPGEEQLLLDGRTLPIRYHRDYAGPVINPTPWARDTLVLPDALFAELMAEAPPTALRQLTTWSGPSWGSREMQQAKAELDTRYPADGSSQLSMTLDPYQVEINKYGMSLFIGGFVSLVFFAAAFSLLYSRLFTEVDQDRRYFRRLQQLGLSQPELKRLAVGQAAVIFFVPFLGGLLHSTFAMLALGTVMNRTVLHYGWMVALAYLVLYGIGFRATASFYWRSLQVGLDGQ